MKVFSILLCSLLLNTSAFAQGVGPDDVLRHSLAWSPEKQGIADKLSTGLVVGALAAPCLLDRTWRCLGHEGVRVGAAIGIAELVKHTVHRTRPDGSDQKSFFSEHTAITCAAVAGSKLWAICPSVAYLRVAADRHWASDVAVGSLFITVTW